MGSITKFPKFSFLKVYIRVPSSKISNENQVTDTDKDSLVISLF